MTNLNRLSTPPLPRVSAGALTPFGIELRKLRVENRKRIFDLARDLGVSSSSVSAWETGRRDIQASDIQRIGEVLKLTDIELERLKRAAEISRGRVVIEAQSPNARILANALKEKINSLSSETIRDLMRYFESSTLRLDRRVRSRSREEIVDRVQTLRKGLGTKDTEAFDIVRFYDFNLATIFADVLGEQTVTNVRFEIWDDNEMPKDISGMSSIFPPHIIISNRKYEDAAAGGYGGRWVMSHELGHLWLLHGIDDLDLQYGLRGPEFLIDPAAEVLPDGAFKDVESAIRKVELNVLLPFQAPPTVKKIPFRVSAEGQADEFAAELLMPSSECLNLLPHNISKRYGVSKNNAAKRLKFLNRARRTLH